MNKILGDVIRSAKTLKGYSQVDVYSLTGVDPKTISLIERGLRNKPKKETLIKLAIALDLSIYNLLLLAGYDENDINSVCNDKYSKDDITIVMI